MDKCTNTNNVFLDHQHMLIGHIYIYTTKLCSPLCTVLRCLNFVHHTLVPTSRAQMLNKTPCFVRG